MGKEKEIYIVGSGPSLQNFNFSSLINRDTIGVNRAVESIPNPTYFIVADSGIIRKAVRANFWNMDSSTIKVVVMGPEHKRYKQVKGVLNRYDRIIKPSRFDGEISFDKNHFATGKNTGFCALQLAVLLGYKKIYLLGIDLTADRGKRHFYSKEMDINPGRCLKNFYKHFVRGLAILHTMSDVKVYSCSPISRLNKHIEYTPIEKVLEDNR
ncbi:MAG: hypothetical protein ACTSUP_09745 [Candidatus Heimdallarchaeaceae archaeon]